MKRLLFIKAILLLVSFFSCNPLTKEKISKVGWIATNICNHWVIQLPVGASLKGFGCTNHLNSPGFISFPNDSTQIKFYAFSDPIDVQSDCDFDALVKLAKEYCSEGICQGDGSVSYKLSPYIDYRRKIAGTLGKAKDSSKHLTSFEVSDCTNWTLTLISKSLSTHYDEMASEIMKSVETIKRVDQK